MAKQNKETTQGKANNLIVGIVIILVLCLFVGVYFLIDSRPQPTYTTDDNNNNAQSSTISSSNSQTQQDTLDTSLSYYADIKIKDYGIITVKLDPVNAPITCENFINLANDKFYDGLTFHRIIEDFMMQGGDPQGDGYGGSKKTIEGEFTSNGHKNPLSHTRGAISMARSGDPNSASSQFFIVHQDSTFLDGDYAVFGYVTEGIDVVDKVCKKATPTDNNGTITKNQQPIIDSITIREE